MIEQVTNEKLRELIEWNSTFHANTESKHTTEALRELLVRRKELCELRHGIKSVIDEVVKSGSSQKVLMKGKVIERDKILYILNKYGVTQYSAMREMNDE
ncbi:MAG TPA: hypothetical protein VMW53_07315 [archaeon]|nr:hypothetical protein [archaeon]